MPKAAVASVAAGKLIDKKPAAKNKRISADTTDAFVGASKIITEQTTPKKRKYWLKQLVLPFLIVELLGKDFCLKQKKYRL